MAVTVDDAARSSLNAVGSNAGLMQAIKWLSERYRQLSNRSRLRALRRVAELTIPATIDTGTATTTRGSTTVTGNAAAQAVWAADPVGIRRRVFRIRRNWYRIAAVVTTSTTTATLELESPFAEESSTAANYKIAADRVPLPEDCRFLGRFVQMRLWRPLVQVAISELDFMHPERVFTTGTGPEIFAEVGDGEDGRRELEFYPYPNEDEMIRFTYYAKSPDLRPGNVLPDDLDIEALKQGVLIDIYRFEMAKALRTNMVEQAAVWRNEMRAQEKTWEDRMAEMMRADRSADDLSVILHTQGPPVHGDMTFIRTASQDAISRLTNFP